MTIRAFDWRDLPVLIRYRDQGLFFDNELILTRGPVLIPAGALLSFFAPAMGIYTYVSTEDHRAPLLGQVSLPSGSQLARLVFLAPVSAGESYSLQALLEHMVVQLGQRGAFHLLAEVEERTPTFELLRKSGFAIYVRQRIWQLNDATAGSVPQAINWQVSKDSDLIPVRMLYNNLVPPLVQQVEPVPAEPLIGLLYRSGDELLAYVELHYGLRGILVQPFIHPDAEGVTADLVDLLRNLPNRRARPIYICVRSYQSWVEQALEELGAKPGLQQAVMVKHLVITQRKVPAFALPKLETGQPEASAPFIHVEIKDRK